MTEAAAPAPAWPQRAQPELARPELAEHRAGSPEPDERAASAHGGGLPSAHLPSAHLPSAHLPSAHLPGTNWPSRNLLGADDWPAAPARPPHAPEWWATWAAGAQRPWSWAQALTLGSHGKHRAAHRLSSQAQLRRFLIAAGGLFGLSILLLGLGLNGIAGSSATQSTLRSEHVVSTPINGAASATVPPVQATQAAPAVRSSGHRVSSGVSRAQLDQRAVAREMARWLNYLPRG